MRVIVDTSVWSLAFRRRQASEDPAVATLVRLIHDGAAVLLGCVRQEVLSGIRHREQFDRLRDRLAAFPDVLLFARDYELAAELCNRCMSEGIQASHTDFLIAAAAMDRSMAVLTKDADFANIAKVVPVELIPAG
jgi:predicted nucleic acid-binding protein